MLRPQMIRKVAAVAACWLVVTSTMLFATTGVAGACSCEGVSAETFEWADGGLFGTVLEVEEFSYNNGFGEQQDQLVFLFDVEIDLLDNLPDQLLVESEKDDGGNCGITLSVGDQLGMVVREDNEGVVRGGGCGEFGMDFVETFVPSGEATKQVSGGVTAEQRAEFPTPTPIPPPPQRAIDAPPPAIVPPPIPIPVEAFPPDVAIAAPGQRPLQDNGSSSAIWWIVGGVVAILGLTGAVAVAAKD